MDMDSGLMDASLTGRMGHAWRLWVACSCLLLCWMGQSARAANIDSLRKVIAALPADTASVITISKLSQLARADGQPEAVEFAQAAVDMARQLGEPRYYGDALCGLGLTMSFQGEYESALKYNALGEEQFRKVGYEPGIVRALMNIAFVYLYRHNYDLAKDALLEAQEIVNRLHLDKFKGNLNTNLAIIYTEEKQYDKALALYQESLKMLENSNDPLRISVCLTNIGFLFYTQARYAEALPYFEQAYVKSKEAPGGRYYEGAFALQNIVSTLTELGKTTEAKRRLQELWPIAHMANSPSLVSETYRSSAKLHALLGDYKQAYTDYEHYTAMHDSLVDEDQNAEIAAMQKENAILKRDATIARIEEETKLLKAAQVRNAQDAERKSLYITGLTVLGCLLFAALIGMLFTIRSRSRALRSLLTHQRMIEAQNQEIDLQNQALKIQNERLEDLNREKDGLVGIVAHDLKSPMNKALALSELLRLQGELNADQQRSVDMIGRVARAGNDLIRDLLDLHAIEDPDAPVQRELVDLGQLLQELKVGFEGEAKRKSITIHVEAAPGLPKTYLDRNAMSRVLDNLLSNALKFSPAGRQIFLRARPYGQMRLRIEVEDQGPGISLEDRQKLFKKFQRLTARPTGGENSTGLGLAITQALVQKLGGEITVSSELGKGTIFGVEVPIKEVA